MFEVVALAVAIQVSVNWLTYKLSPSAPSEVQNIEVTVDADDLVCTKDTQFVIESKVLGGRYKLEGLSYDVLEANDVEVPRFQDEITKPEPPSQEAPMAPEVRKPVVPEVPFDNEIQLPERGNLYEQVRK